jgi:DNA polymerase (family X)
MNPINRVSNDDLVKIFEEMADLLELSGENMFRVRAYRTGAAAIANLSQQLSDLIASGHDLTEIEGIGSTLAEKSKVILETGVLPQLEKLREEVPPSLRDIMRVPGLGAKKAMKLFQELGVKDLQGLRQACIDQGLRREDSTIHPSKPEHCRESSPASVDRRSRCISNEIANPL